MRRHKHRSYGRGIAAPTSRVSSSAGVPLMPTVAPAAVYPIESNSRSGRASSYIASPSGLMEPVAGIPVAQVQVEEPPKKNLAKEVFNFVKDNQLVSKGLDKVGLKSVAKVASLFGLGRAKPRKSRKKVVTGAKKKTRRTKRK